MSELRAVAESGVEAAAKDAVTRGVDLIATVTLVRARDGTCGAAVVSEEEDDEKGLRDTLSLLLSAAVETASLCGLDLRVMQTPIAGQG